MSETHSSSTGPAYANSRIIRGVPVLVRGMVPVVPEAGQELPNGLYEQTRNVLFVCLGTLLLVNDLPRSSVARLDVFAKADGSPEGHDRFEAGRLETAQLYGAFFDDNEPPTRTYVGASQLPLDSGVLIEITPMLDVPAAHPAVNGNQSELRWPSHAELLEAYDRNAPWT